MQKLIDEPEFAERLFTDDDFYWFNGYSRGLDRYEHTLKGLVEDGVAGGFHYYPSRGSNTSIVRIIRTPNAQGVYQAEVIINGVLKSSPSTFFPDNWTEQQVLGAINRAYRTKRFIGIGSNPRNDEYESVVDNIQIRLIIDRETGGIVTAHPLM